MRYQWVPVVLAVFVSPTIAHDLWLVPADKQAGKTIVVEASVGMDFPGSVSVPKVDAYPRKFVAGPNGKQRPLKAAGKKEKTALLEFEPTTAGIYVVAVETTPRIIELDADRFNAYLISDGMPHIYRLRFEEKTLNRPGRERYRKSPTALVRVGDANAGVWNKPLDLPLQIVPLQNPFERKVGDTLRVQVLFQQKPLKDANVGWQRAGDGESAGGYVRTDAKGEALIPIAAVGLMTVRLTHMTRPKLADYEWESFWTTLTFRIP